LFFHLSSPVPFPKAKITLVGLTFIKSFAQQLQFISFGRTCQGKALLCLSRLSFQKVSIAHFGAIIQRSESSENGPNGDQPPNPVKAILKMEKNRDGIHPFHSFLLSPRH
jgi:hypothetical protein